MAEEAQLLSFIRLEAEVLASLLALEETPAFLLFYAEIDSIHSTKHTHIKLPLCEPARNQILPMANPERILRSNLNGTKRKPKQRHQKLIRPGIASNGKFHSERQEMILPGIVMRNFDAEPIFSFIIVVKTNQLSIILVVEDHVLLVIHGARGGVVTVGDQDSGFEFDGGILIEFEADCEGDGVPDVGAVEVEVVVAVEGVGEAEGKEGQKGDYLGGFIHRVIINKDINKAAPKKQAETIASDAYRQKRSFPYQNCARYFNPIC